MPTPARAPVGVCAYTARDGLACQNTGDLVISARRHGRTEKDVGGTSRNPGAATAATGVYNVPTMAPENQPATVMLQGFSIPTANI